MDHTQQSENSRPLQKVRKESREDYLKALYILSMHGAAVRSVQLAARLNFSRASVSTMLGAMKNDGLITMADDFTIHLTDAGRAEAEKVYARYRFFEQLLLQSGVEGDCASVEAGRLEHMLSDESFEKLRTMLASWAACTEGAE